MATYYMELTKGTKTRQIREKLKAFELLYGKATMYIKGTLPIRDKQYIVPATLTRSKILKLGTKKTITVCVDEHEGEAVILLDFLYILSRMESTPEIMFITEA